MFVNSHGRSMGNYIDSPMAIWALPWLWCAMAEAWLNKIILRFDHGSTMASGSPFEHGRAMALSLGIAMSNIERPCS